jgi:hypothetical protein
MGNTPGVHFKSISEKLKRLYIDPCTQIHSHCQNTSQNQQSNRNGTKTSQNIYIYKKEVKRTKALENKKTVGFYLLEGLAMGEE